MMSFLMGSTRKVLIGIGAISLVVGLSACDQAANNSKTAESDAQKTEVPKEDKQNAQTVAASADSSKGAEADVVASLEDRITAKLNQAGPGLKVTKIEPTPVKGINKVELAGRGQIYAVDDGDYFFVGDLYQIDKNEVVNITEKEKNGLRAELLAQVKSEDFITFPSKGPMKARISVFTDVDCGYCQKLHQEVPALNDMGIEVRYLAYPRAGVGSGSYKKIASAWCADDKLTAMTKLKQREVIPQKDCDNPVASQYQLGQKMGVTGTPAILLDSGDLLPGYMPAKRLAARLGI